MDILSEIVAHKRKQVALRKEKYPVKILEQSAHFERQPISLKADIQMQDSSGVIAEIKRKSPSKGIINKNVSVAEIASGYEQAGASGISVLTDDAYFGGSTEDFEAARAISQCPLLRKDFMIDEYQIIEAKSMGADVILLIAAVLSKNEVEAMATLAKTLEMEVLLEVHNIAELQASLTDKVDLLGVNNRNLKTFTTDIQTSKDIAPDIPDDFVKVAESGLHSPDVVNELKRFGFEGFLIGESFMKEEEPAKAAREFIQQLI